MLRVYLAGTDITEYVQDGSVAITEQIQNKANTAALQLNPGISPVPAENQEIEIFDVVELVSASSTDLVVEDSQLNGVSILDFGKFRRGENFWMGIGTSDRERVVISSIEEGSAGQVDITLESTPVTSHSAGTLCGKLIFAGTIANMKRSNPRLLTDVDYSVSLVDFTKIFDKKLINDSWQAVDINYIINDFFNTTINFNMEVDDMDYDNDTAARAVWTESNDGDQVEVETDDIMQGSSAVKFPWTNSSGTASFTAALTTQNVSEITGAASGTPLEGNVTFWYYQPDETAVSTVKVKVGSDASNFVEVQTTLGLTEDEYVFVSLSLVDGTVTGTPDWENMDYADIEFTETADSYVLIDDLRLTADDSFTLYNIKGVTPIDDARASFKKPTVFTDQLAKSFGYFWYIDYERDLHFYQPESTVAPFEITETSNNFVDLAVDVDTNQLKNRQVVRGSTKTSDSQYSQVVEGDDAVREWILKGQFKNLEIYLDNNTSTDTMESGTTTTDVVATAHGLADGDYIVNRTRSNAVRKITYVDADNFTVEAVPSQTNGDTFSKFATSKSVGPEGLTDETAVDYVSNFNEKSIRATDSEATLDAGEFLLFRYNEIVPIRVQSVDTASIANMKALLGGDGIFDGAPITDKSIDSQSAAKARADAEINQFSNPIVKVTFKTDYEGLHAGQLIDIQDSNRSINDSYTIQKVKASYRDGFAFPNYTVTAASTLFGLVEYFQKLAQSLEERLVDEEEVIDQIIGENVAITISESNSFTPAHEASETATITVGESNTVTERDVTTDPYVWQPDASDARWNLAQWG